MKKLGIRLDLKNVYRWSTSPQVRQYQISNGLVLNTTLDDLMCVGDADFRNTQKYEGKIRLQILSISKI